jgi:hypothetical protein
VSHAELLQVLKKKQLAEVHVLRVIRKHVKQLIKTGPENQQKLANLT